MIPPSYFHKPHVVYRFFAADGALLYIGATSDLKSRTATHRTKTPWFGEVASVETENHPDRWRATSAERDAIESERPRYNFNHNRGHGQNVDGRTRRHARRTVDKIARAHDIHPWQGARPGDRTAVVHPYALAPLFTSLMSGCLSHRTRYGMAFNIGEANQRVSYTAECGVTINDAVPVEARDEFFMCCRCFAVCEEYGLDTLNMVPATGCEVSGGVRGKSRRGKADA